MASYGKHNLNAYFDGIDHLRLKKNENVAENRNIVNINSIEYDGDRYVVVITIDKLSDPVKECLSNNNGDIFIEFGHLTHAGTGYIATYGGTGRERRSIKRFPSHYFKSGSTFEENIPSSDINKSNTFTFYLYEDELIGLERDKSFSYRYRDVNVAQQWQYLTFRIKVRITITDNPMDYPGCTPYYISSDEIIAYCKFY